jgi:hypothetical protein
MQCTYPAFIIFILDKFDGEVVGQESYFSPLLAGKEGILPTPALRRHHSLFIRKTL